MFGKNYSVVVKIVDHPSCTSVYNGFVESMKEKLEVRTCCGAYCLVLLKVQDDAWSSTR